MFFQPDFAVCCFGYPARIGVVWNHCHRPPGQTIGEVGAINDTHELAAVQVAGGRELGPWTTAQRAFFIPLQHIDETWNWSQENKGELDMMKHPNTGCMHDDHSIRAEWNSTVRDKCPSDKWPSTIFDCRKQCSELLETHQCSELRGYCDKSCGFPPTNPVIRVAYFPCNVPGTGCNDTQFSGPPACGCFADLPLPDDAPRDSCRNCIDQYHPPRASPSAWYV